MNTEPTITETAAQPGKKAVITAVLLLLTGAVTYAWRFSPMGTPAAYGLFRLLFLGAAFVLPLALQLRSLPAHAPGTLHILSAAAAYLLLDGVLYLMLAPDGSGITGTRNLLLLAAAYLPCLLYGAVMTLLTHGDTLPMVESMSYHTCVAVMAATIAGELALFYLPGEGLVSVVGGRVLMLFPICCCLGKGVSAAVKGLQKNHTNP